MNTPSQDVEQDTEAVARAIAADAGVEYVFTGRMKTGSGQLNVRAKPPKPKNE